MGAPGADSLERLHLRQAELEAELASVRRRIAAAGAPTGQDAAPGAGAGELHRLRAILASVTGYAVFTTDPAGVVTGWNPGAEALMGWTEAEALGLDARVLFTPEDVAAGVPEREMAEALACGVGVDERWHMRRDGTRYWANGLLMPLRGNGAGFVKVARDRTESHHVETALRDSEARLRLVVENARDHAILVADPEGRITDWLPGAQAVFGWSAEAAVGQPAAMIFTPEDREQGVPEREFETARRNGAAPNVRWHLREDGSRVFIQGTLAAMRDAGGELRGFLKIGQDVTERQAAEERLRRSEALFRTLATGIQALVFRGGPDGWRTWPSPQWVDFTSLNFEDSLGLGWLEAVHPEDRGATLAAWREAAGSGEYYAEHRIRHAADSAWRWHQTRARPLDGAGSEWVGAMTDVHDLRELQGRQGVLVAELQHRTRNLLAVVRALAEKTMAGAANPDEFREVFRDRLSALSRVQGLLSRLAEGERVTFDGLIRTELTALGALDADGRGPQVVLDGPESVRLRSGTVQTFALALHELATNAVKYGALSRPGGRLLVRWRAEREGDGERRLQVDWRESGVAMPEAAAAPRACAAPSRYPFRPRGWRTPNMPDVQSRAGLAGRRVLVAEDDYLIADALCQGLEAAGAEVVGPAPDVAAALALLAEGTVDAAVLDVNLGGEMAWPAADALLARGVRFVFATGYDASVIPARYAGVTCCEKPVRLVEIARALAG